MSAVGCSKLLLVAWIAPALVVGACARSRADEGDGARDAAPPTASASGPRVGSCDRVAQSGTCSEYAGSYLADNELFVSGTCTKLGGTFSRAACPNTSVLGTCTLSTSEVRMFYGGHAEDEGAQPFDAARARAECESLRGTWRPR